MMKGIIFSLLCCYYHQNTLHSNYLHVITLLYCWLAAYGWDRSYLKIIFIQADQKIKNESKKTTQNKNYNKEEINNKEFLIIHWTFHFCNIPQGTLQQLFNNYCSIFFDKDIIGIKKAIIAYHHPKNICDSVTQAKLHQAPGQEASIIMGILASG